MDNLTNVTTGEVRLSYVHLFKPYAFKPGQEEKYQVTILVPKTDTATMARINAAIETAKQKGTSEKWNGLCPPILSTPVHDGDGVRPSDGMPFGAECKGHWVFTASAKAGYPPEVVDSQMNPIINQSEVYSGIYGKVNISFYPYNYDNMKKGIGCSLGAVMKTRDGESLGGSMPTAAQAFGIQPGAQASAPQYGAAYASQAQYSQPQAAPWGPAQQTAVNPITGLPY